ncbi:hypothetical protein [Longibaculum muris]|uniref:hypothetical protein n=1 Tax=Longibaculum muris TaxID=1796628 RepID=UPI0022E65230|nr:hypothetical protein [Longibaculum muris]
MKRNDLNAIITGIVHRYIEDGWVLEMSNASYSDVEGVHFLSRGRERVAVGIRRPERGELDGRLSDLRGLDPRILFECRATKRAFDWLVPENAIGERVFFKVADDWYVEDICSFEEAKAKRRERWMSRNEEREASLCSFHPTKAFLDKWVRGEYGWKTVKPSDVLVKRERICGRGFYFITKVSRKGANPVLTVDIPRVR